ncbi:MAG: hypothetical protein ABF651_06880 [Sporolactobacillus sp.]
MFLQTNHSVIAGICLILLGLLISFSKKLLPKLLRRTLFQRIGKRLYVSAGLMIVLAGVYLILCPLLIVMMGEDYWILFILGIIACCMLFILLLLD